MRHRGAGPDHSPTPDSQGHRGHMGAMDPPSDSELVDAALKGDRVAQEELFRRYAVMANAQAFRLAPWPDEVDDIVQDAYLEALRHLHRLQDPSRFAGWFRTIVVRMAMRRIRRHKLQVRLGLARQHDALDADAFVSNLAPPDIQTELRQVYTHIENLPTQARVALILQRVEHLTIREIAERMGVSEPTVKRRLRKANGLLAKHLAAGGPRG